METRPPALARIRRLPRPRAGVRTRVLAWFLVLLACSTVASTLTIRTVLLKELDAEIDEQLAQEVAEVEQLKDGNNPQTGKPFGTDVAALFHTFLARNIPGEGEGLYTIVDGEPYRRSNAAPFPGLLDQETETGRALVARLGRISHAERGVVDTPIGEARYLAVPLVFGGETTGVFIVANFPAQERAEIDLAVRIIAVVSGVVLLLAAALAWLAAGRALTPLRALADTTQAISDTDLSQRIEVHGRDEVAELATRFNAMLDRLGAAFADQRRFLDDVSHELRTPITIIRGHLELMGIDPEERRETLALVTDELDHMSRLVSDLLVLARAERPDFLQPRAIDVDDLVDSVFLRAKALADRDWRVELRGTGVLLADPDRLAQALINLAANAAHHTAPGDLIVIGATVEDQEARFWVRDHGPGIPPEEQERLFQRFARGSPRRVHAGGVGLGLAIVKAIAEAHGGRVELHSRPGAGATFTIAVPGVLPPPPGVETSPGAAIPIRS